MGGAAGHMSHPFDDKDLTFKDLKKIIKKSFDGEQVKKVKKRLDLYTLLFVRSGMRIERITNLKGKKSYE